MPREPHLSSDTDADTHLPLAGAEETFSAVVAIVDRFVADWDSQENPPEVGEYLPETVVVRRAALLELVRSDFEQRAARGESLTRIEEYARQFPELIQEPVPAELVLAEIEARRQLGESVSNEEYLKAYPHCAEYLGTRDGQGERQSTIIASPGEDAGLEDIDVGQSVDDFDLLAGLGRGAFARVFLARQRSLQRLVAVKISHIQGTEPQTLAQLDHDYIVRVFDQQELTDRKLRLLYMQYLPGGTLEAAVKKVRATHEKLRSGKLLVDVIDDALEGRGESRPVESSVRETLASLSWPEAVAWLGSRLALALDYAANKGVLHRDVKPANVLLTAEGIPKLADFNISFSEEVQGSSPGASFGGSLNYMSPEQLRACHPSLGGKVDDLDRRSDLYSLGIVLWELLTGSKPFRGEIISGDWQRTVNALHRVRQKPLSADLMGPLPPDCPPTLQRVLLRCLSFDSDDRWQTGAEMSAQLELCLDAEARALVDPPPTSWRNRLRTWRIPLLVLAILGPNGVAAVYNYHHNRARIVEQLPGPVIDRFEMIQTVINGIAFPLGVAVCVYLSRRVLTVPRRLQRGEDFTPEELTQTRVDTLRMADRTVLVCLALWVVAGIAYPISMHFAAGGMPPGSSEHFLGSLVICGLIATAYPFFAISSYAVRSLYPELIPYGVQPEPDGTELARLGRRASLWLALAASVPLLAVAGLTFVVRRDVPTELALMRIVCGTGILGFGAVYWLSRQLEGDMTALQRVIGRQ